MVNFKALGFSTFDEYFADFMESLLPSNKTYEYFVDWKKVKAEIRNRKQEIFLLNSLRENRSIDELREEMTDLIEKHPEVSEAVPLLIAERIRNGGLHILDPEQDELISYDFTRDVVRGRSECEKLVRFCERTGILDLILGTKDLYDYLLGVEVGLDTNARKNRSGDIFQKLVHASLNKNLQGELTIVSEDPSFSLYRSMSSRKMIEEKTHDFVIYSHGEPRFVIEANFYNVIGSKPPSIAESYSKMSEAAETRNVDFVWITDGPAWRLMQNPLKRAMTKSGIEFILNYRMIPAFGKAVKKGGLQ